MAYCAYCGTEVMAANGMPCPSCSNPKNGAPRIGPVAKKGLSTGAIVLIVAVIALPVIIAIVGMIAAIAIPNFLTAVQRAKQKRTMADMRSVGAAIDAYKTEHRSVPAGNDVSALRAALVPTYLKSVPDTDGWAHPWRYECWSATGGEGCDSYALGSGAKDGRFQEDSIRSYAAGTATTNFDCDIIFANGTFVQYPEGLITRD